MLTPQVGKGGLEPPRIAAPDPKSGPSASSGTPPAFIPTYYNILTHPPQDKEAGIPSPNFPCKEGPCLLTLVMHRGSKYNIRRGDLRANET